MKLDTNDVVLVRIKSFRNECKVADKWEQTPYMVIEEIPNRPVFKVQNLEDHTKFRTLHRNMFYSLKTVKNDDTQDIIVESVSAKLSHPNDLMMKHFDSP